METPLSLCRLAARAFLALPVLALAFVPSARAQRVTHQPQGSGGVQVRVSTADRQETVTGAEVTLVAAGRAESSLSGYTDVSGRVMFDGIRPGAYQVVVRKEGFETARENVLVATAGRENFFIQLRRSAEGAAGGMRASTVSARKADVPERARKAYEEGVASLKDDPAKSVGHFRRAVEAYPKYADAYLMLGYAHLRKGEKAEAVTALAKAVELDPKLTQAHLLLGKIYLDDKKPAEAEKPLRESVALDQQSSEAHLRLAHCLYLMNKLDEALPLARRSLELPNASPLTYLLLADLYLARNEKKEALQHLEKFEKADPQNPLVPRVKQMIERLRAGG